ncbi:Serine/threonine protein kinase [Amycolatopsis arida]|uniref:non-specific serine/threonine protein kinase n=1 Tax=Amycolatopsis arida TaxID=587909 RepID=A0A1I5VGU2_9PSEU|nr:serine/threonine-protein kinase [Amycolatopsis arida]TDX91263.1 serine/threonine protein kinase [Amycolatopsis arida]SFQ06196.1 Serine/threonine protein kinase [Amycolatopsis arida]
MTDELTQQQTQPAPAATTPRTIAGRYVLRGELGRGGMGIVWRAEDTVIGRQVAVKELRLPDGADDTEVFQERVLREVRTGGRLNDPAVVTVFDVVADGDATFIVMELVEAPTLSDLVRQHGPMPPHQVASIGLQVLSALQAAHEAGIVHRDVKPGNIMVGPGGRVKLTDFGIAQAVDDPRLTTSGMLVGSPAFMAPERVAGREALPASDLWSLGATLFFAVEGTVAFERSSTAATLHAILHEVPYLTHAQGPLASAIMSLLIANPEARITVAQAHGLLSMAAAQQGQSTPPGGQTMPYPGQAPTMLSPAGGPTPPLPGQAPPANPANPAKRTVLLVAGTAAVVLLVAGLFLGRWIFSPPTDNAMLPTMTYGEGGAITELGRTSGSDWCLNTQLTGGWLVDSNWVDCDDPHYLQLYASLNGLPLASSSSSSDATVAKYPGEERLRELAERWCSTAFHGGRVNPNDPAQLQYRALVPTEKEWAENPTGSGANPTRAIHCFVGSARGQLTKSVVVDLK